MKFLIYGRENCIHCSRAKKFLDDKGISYKYVDMTKWPIEDVRDLAREHGMTTVPIVLTDDSVVIGGADDLMEYVSEMSHEF